MNNVKEIRPASLAVAGSALIASMCSGMIFAAVAISLFIDSLQQDYGWNRTRVGGAVTCLFVGMAVGAPIFGRLIDRKGPRAILLPLVVVSGLLLCSLSLTGPVLPLFYAAHFCLGLAQPGAVAYSKMLSTWFFRHRGIALTAIGIGALCAQTLAPPVIRALQNEFGWQGAYLALGATELLIAFPVLFAFFREPRGTVAGSDARRHNEIHPDGAPPIAVRQAVTGRNYWLLIGAQFAGMFAFMGTTTHGVGILTERGLPSTVAVWGLSVFAVGGLVVQPLTGLLLDRFNSPRVMLPFAFLSLASLIVLQLTSAQWTTLTAFLLFGVGCGGQTSMTSYLTTRYFGVRNFSSIYGTLFPVLILASAPAPALIGAVFDATGSYRLALVGLEIALLGPIICGWLLRPYPYPVDTKGQAA